MFIRNRFIVSISTLLLLVGCVGLAPKFYDESDSAINDATLGLTRDDYRNLPFTEPKEPPIPPTTTDADYGGFKTDVSGAPNEPPIPDVAPILAAPSAPKIGQTKLVSLSVTDDVPLKDVFLELARLADVDVEVDANIVGGISFRANQRPFNEVVERICDFAGLRYSMKNSVLRIERDEPYVEIYSLDFLNIERTSTSSVNVSTSVLSGGGGGGGGGGGKSPSGGGSSGGGGLNTGSSASITASTDSDFWKQFEASVKGILEYQVQRRMSEFSPTPTQTDEEEDSLTSAPNSPSPPPAGPGSRAPTPNSQTPLTPGGVSPAGGAAQYTLNRQAGTLSVVATARQHRLVEEFIKTLEFNASAQVLIEAKIVEVTLKEGFENGIDWNKLGGRSLSATSLLGGLSSPSNALNLTFKKNNLTGLDIDLDTAIKLTQNFGTTRTLSSPRLHAINNQQAVMTFAKNQVYFTIDVEREVKDAVAGGGAAQTTYTVNSSINTVPIGIIMTVLPSINRRTGDVTLNVRPTLSRVVSQVEDPGLAVTLASDPSLSNLNVKNFIPVVEVRELDSILKVQSGEVMVIGGLMEDIASQDEGGVPGASEIPVVGNLFKGIARKRETKELIIFIRPTIVGKNGSADSADKNLYDKFTRDPRPFNFQE